MLRIPKVDEQLSILTKPVLKETNSISICEEDCLVLCAGFEERALAFLRAATSGSSARFRILVIKYHPPLDENKSLEIDEVCRNSELHPMEVDYNRKDPAGFGDVFLEKLESLRGRLYVDISGMSRLLIVQILVALGGRDAGFSGSSVLYSEATDYPPSRSEVENAIAKSDVDPLFSMMLLSSGVFEVMIIPELSSVSLGSPQTRLVAFPSFNTDQLTALRTELQPSRYSIIHGVPPAPENGWRKDAIATLNHTDSLETEENYFTSTLDYRESFDCLLKIYAKHGVTERILIAPTGSKMQAVAVGIFRSFISDVQIVYPTPRTFTSPTNYTIGVKRLYHLPLDTFPPLKRK